MLLGTQKVHQLAVSTIKSLEQRGHAKVLQSGLQKALLAAKSKHGIEEVRISKSRARHDHCTPVQRPGLHLYERCHWWMAGPLACVLSRGTLLGFCFIIMLMCVGTTPNADDPQQLAAPFKQSAVTSLASRARSRGLGPSVSDLRTGPPAWMCVATARCFLFYDDVIAIVIDKRVNIGDVIATRRTQSLQAGKQTFRGASSGEKTLTVGSARMQKLRPGCRQLLQSRLRVMLRVARLCTERTIPTPPSGLYTNSMRTRTRARARARAHAHAHTRTLPWHQLFLDNGTHFAVLVYVLSSCCCNYVY